MFEAIARGEIKALWVMATNPASRCRAPRTCASAAEARSVRRVRKRRSQRHRERRRACSPARGAWGEKDGTVTNSERRISRQRRFCRGRARPSRTGGSSRVRAPHGFAELSYHSARTMFREHAALVGFENDGRARLRHRRARA
jgi:assimilatory nitrate reductase catalytic subunit